VLGIDPGLVATGYGLLGSASAGVAVLATGVITTTATLTLDARVQQVYDGVLAVLDRFEPASMVLEDLYAEYRFPRTALLMAHVRGVICLAARQRGVTLVAIAPGEVKRAVAGHGAASKAQVQQSVRRLLSLAALPAPSHVADALALAFTGYSRAGGRLAAAGVRP
jgi:crossover junction endodeoxyribonuclease RuvC